MDFREFTAKSVGEAITQACVALGVTSDRLDYAVVQEATGGFLGIGSKPAIIRARIRMEEEPEAARGMGDEEPKAEEAAADLSGAEVYVAETPDEAEDGPKVITSDEIEKRAAAAAAKARVEGRPEVEQRPPKRERREVRDKRNFREKRDRGFFGEEAEIPAYEPSRPKPERVVKPIPEEKAEELKQTAVSFLGDVFRAMKIEVEIRADYDQKEGALSCTFDGEEMGLLIGKRGQTLDSLQYLTSLVVNKKSDDYVRVKLDTEDYRARRADTLNNLARNIAYKVKKTHRPVSLEPMNPYERRIIHSSLQGNRFVETYSEGEEPYRHVVVTPKRG